MTYARCTAVALSALAALLCAGSAAAQTIYRCGADGRTYSQTPCAQGQAYTVNAPAPDESQRQEAQSIADRERALADTLQQDRLDREAQPRAAAIGIDGRIGYQRETPDRSERREAPRKTSGTARPHLPKAAAQPERYRSPSATRS